MIRKMIQRINEGLEDGLRGILGRLTPDGRIILVVTMFLVLAALSIYMTVSSIYNFGREKGEQMYIRQIETLKLQQEQQRDSINNLNNHYEYERTNQ
nr:TraL conjugative transposon family protein [Parabacteroides goldsteinii]